MIALRLVVGGLALGWLAACAGEHQSAGTPQPRRAPAAVIAQREARRTLPPPSAPDGAVPNRQILFGDLHVHTTFSADAFILSLPLMGGEGVHPPADACDYARFCAGLDFWSINDHAEGLTPAHWRDTVEAIQRCNASPGGEPDTVAFLGWEWSQVGATAEQHFGHKNVILREWAEDRVPVRPVAAPRPDFRAAPMPLLARALLPLVHFPERQRYFDYFHYLDEVEATPLCPQDVDPMAGPADCHDVAHDPAELFERLDRVASDSLVIPHGTSWGLMTPPGTSWAAQLRPGQHDPARQRLIEVYSGHGSSEVDRDWRAFTLGPDGEIVCPEPSPEYLPCCWQAGEIVRARCGALGADACEEAVRKARRDHVASGASGHRSIPGATVEDWLDCGQCRDCFLPAFNYRPGLSAQNALARGGFDAGAAPRRMRMGLIASSDTHAARAGNGFKEFGRHGQTEARGLRGVLAGVRGDTRQPEPISEPVDVVTLPLAARRNTERGASLLTTGGLVAVHAAGRDRDAIFEALERREVYGTSGDRILLSFHLLDGPRGAVPMGGEVDGFVGTPRFRVAAAGAFVQKPGCPPWVTAAVPADELARLCLGECYNPGDRRRRMTRIEVVRIQPQIREDEPLPGRIEDPWRRLPCPPDPDGCVVEFEDPDFAAVGRGTLYYVRAIQEPTPAVNGAGLRCERDDTGACLRVRPCFGDERTPIGEDCLAPVEERAWSSPIFLLPAAPAQEAPAGSHEGDVSGSDFEKLAAYLFRSRA